MLFRTLKLWNVKTKTEEKTFTGHTGWVRAVAISPDDKIIASGGEDTLLYNYMN